VGVFWALLFLCHQGRLELEQEGGLFGPLQLRALADPQSESAIPGDGTELAPLGMARRAAEGPAAERLAA
jgi:segregation and condensation protein A